jgi:hypothetical protein
MDGLFTPILLEHFLSSGFPKAFLSYLVLSQFDARDGHHVYGHPSTISFLKEACRMSGGRAKRLVRSADQAQQLFDIYCRTIRGGGTELSLRLRRRGAVPPSER